jgi:hypothetical protein
LSLSNLVYDKNFLPILPEKSKLVLRLLALNDDKSKLVGLLNHEIDLISFAY